MLSYLLIKEHCGTTVSNKQTLQCMLKGWGCVWYVLAISNTLKMIWKKIKKVD
jgi:hypothetical protein